MAILFDDDKDMKLKFASSKILESCNWDPCNFKKRDQITAIIKNLFIDLALDKLKLTLTDAEIRTIVQAASETGLDMDKYVTWVLREHLRRIEPTLNKPPEEKKE